MHPRIFCPFALLFGIVLVGHQLEQCMAAAVKGEELSESTEEGMQTEGNWVEHLWKEGARHSSQANQDGIIEGIFKRIPPVHKLCVEFGFGYTGNDSLLLQFGLFKTNTFNLRRVHGWIGWTFDSEVDAPSLSIYRVALTPGNIVDVFRQHGVPPDVDFVSVDVDSTDLWLLRALLKGGYRPTLVSIEYNAHFGRGVSLTVDDVWKPWERDVVYGASLGAIQTLAEAYGYEVVHVEVRLDVFLVRSDRLKESGGKGFTRQEVDDKFGVTLEVHPLKPTSKLERFIDYDVYEKNGWDMEAARRAAEPAVEELQMFFAQIAIERADGRMRTKEPERSVVVENHSHNQTESPMKLISPLLRPSETSGQNIGSLRNDLEHSRNNVDAGQYR